MENEKFFHKIYEVQEKELDEFLKDKLKELKKSMKKIDIEDILKKKDIDEIKKAISIIEDNNSQKIAYLIQEFYKKGFSDGVKFMLECIKK